MAISLLPNNPFKLLGWFLIALKDKVNELVNAVNAGSSGQSQLVNTFVAGANLSGQRVVYIDSGKAVYFDATDQNLSFLQIGLTDHAAALNANVNVIIDGIIKSAGWGLLAGAVYYADVNGLLTLTPPIAPSIVQTVGVAIDSDTLKINFSQTILTI